MSDEKFAAPTKEVEWMAQPNPGPYGFYDFEMGPRIPEEVALRRARGTIVVAQTAFVARQLGAIALGLAPEHVEVTQCKMTTAVKKTKRVLSNTSSATEKSTALKTRSSTRPSSTREQYENSSSTQNSPTPKPKKTAKKGKKK